MIDIDDLKEFTKLPHIFNARLYSDILQAINEYDSFKTYVIRRLEYYGENAYKNPDAYREVEYDILNEKLPASTEKRLLAVIEKLKKEYASE